MKDKGAVKDKGSGKDKDKEALPQPSLEKMGKGVAKQLKGKYIEIYWDGEAMWFEAEVLGYDDQTRKHLVHYTADDVESEELLSGSSEAAPWRHVIKTTARGAASKAASQADARKALDLPGAPPI